MIQAILRAGFFLVVFVPLQGTAPTDAAEPAPVQIERGFRQTVQPFLQTWCIRCHGKEKPRGGLDLSAFTNAETAVRDHRRWETVLEKLQTGTMPPPKVKSRPTAEARRQVIDWIREMRRAVARRTAGDPGPLLARRLSNAEYDYTIRDLTGVDIRPTREFPVDPANEAGFDNSAESLAMSPALLKKYLEAARRVTNHLVLKPEGFSFAPYPVVADTDRDKYCVRQIINFYRRQPVDYADYFLAAWRFRHRAALGQPRATLADVAAEGKVSPKYLATLWAMLTERPEEMGPIAALQALWRELPAPDPREQDAARPGCERMRDFVVRLRKQLVPEVKNLTAPGIHNGSQTMVLWKNRQFVANRRRYAGGALDLKDTGLTPGTAAARAMTAPVDASAVKRYEATFQRFCSTFPDAFYVSERARVYLDPKKEKQNTGRLLSAGFHSMTGYFRDDGPLYELILDREGQRELDRLWKEFDFITGAPMRQHTSFIWFERTDSTYMRDPEFDVFRAEDRDSTSEASIRALSRVYLAKARRNGASKVALEAIAVHFRNISASIRAVEKARKAAEPTHLVALQKFAERAYRRPLSKIERDRIVSFYRILREKDGLNHKEAVRDSIVSVLMSPHFCYLTLSAGKGESTQRGTRPLSDHALASRLSYFLWASMPDEELLAHAQGGDLHRREVLIKQARRMLRAPRARGLALEFGGNWLDFRRFEEHNSVDRGRFPSFNDELRQAMFEEPVHLFLELVREDRSVLDLLYANHTWVNPVLAKHYGMPKPAQDEWVRVEDAHRYGRGGLLPMAVFLTRNSPGLRTSPVKRGYWVVRRLLGETIPAPPPEVPQLPADEAKLGERTLRETLARHRENASCAACHNRFDSVGLVFEGYGPIGERRDRDLGGRPVDARARFPDGSKGTGLDGLRAYLRVSRQKDFIENLCHKLLVYALGRSLLPSDDLLIDDMKARLEANHYRFGSLVESIITSPQFLNRRAPRE
jgi:mono/diheme cytochrome c family protein